MDVSDIKKLPTPETDKAFDEDWEDDSYKGLVTLSRSLEQQRDALMERLKLTDAYISLMTLPTARALHEGNSETLAFIRQMKEGK